MKSILTLGATLLVLISCQWPNSVALTQPSRATDKATLAVSVASRGFLFASEGSLERGRFIVPPTTTLGLTEYVLKDPAKVRANVTGDSTVGLGFIPPGTWNLTVTQRNSLGAVVARGTVPGVTLNPGANTVTVTLVPTQTGSGTLDVPFSWTTDSVSGGSFELYRLTLSTSAPYTITKTSVAVTSGTDYTLSSAAKTARFTKVLPSGSYQLALVLNHAGVLHPPVTATAEVYDNMVSTLPTVSLTTGQLSSPPNAPPSPALSLQWGEPTLSWNGQASTANGFRLYRDGTQVAAGSVMSTGLSDPSPLPGMLQTYTVRAYNGFGESLDSTPVTFQSVATVGTSLQGTIRVEAGGTAPLTAEVSPSNASYPGVIWSASLPQVAWYNAQNTQVHALKLGTSRITATSVEVGAASGWVDVQVEPLVTTLAGTAGGSGTDDGQGAAANFTSPSAITVGPDNRLYVIDDGGSSIRRIELDGTVSTLSTGYLAEMNGIAVGYDDPPTLYVTAGQGVYSLAGLKYDTPVLLAGDPVSPGHIDDTGTYARFSDPKGIVLSPNGNLYVADSENQVIRMVGKSSGITTTVAGDGTHYERDGTLANSQFSTPVALALTSDNNLYVACLDGFTIRYVDFGNDSVSTVAGSSARFASVDGGPSEASFTELWGIALDGNDLYVTERFRGTLRRVQLPADWYSGSTSVQVSTIAGLSGANGAVEGLGGNARFGYYGAIAARAGVVWLADADNHTIRKIKTSAYDNIGPYDSAFSDVNIMTYDWYSNYLYTGDGQTGNLQVGTILLYNTPMGNKGKMLITGIDPSYNNSPGRWRLHLSYCTWDGGGSSVLSQGTVVLEDIDYTGYYLDLDDGSLVGDSTMGDVYLSGYGSNDDSTRVFNPAAAGVLMGIYR